MGMSTTKNNIKTIRKGDPVFFITGKITLTPRAGFEIKKECPISIAETISRAIACGWLTPVAYMRDDELAWDTLKE